MIVRDRCLILHMPKTGGVFIRMLLEKHYGDAVMLPSGNSFEDPGASVGTAPLDNASQPGDRDGF